MYSQIFIIQRLLGMAMPVLIPILFIVSIFFIYKLFTTKDQARATNKKRMIISLVSLFLSVVLWGVAGLFGSMMGVGQGGSAPIPGMPISMDLRQGGSAPIPGVSSIQNYESSNYGYNNNYNNNNTTSNGDIKDTRDFTKKSFSATLKTREVEDVAKKVEVLVKGMDGRIDSSDISPEYATISFVIPKDKLSDFEDQVKTYTNKKLYVQRVSSQNLVGEKKNLERNQDEVKKKVAFYEEGKILNQNNYKETSDAFKAQIESRNSQLKTVILNIARKENQLNDITDATIQFELNKDIILLKQDKNSLASEIQSFNNELAKLTNTYSSQKSLAESMLKEQNNQLANLGTQTESFLDKVETVEGLVKVENISLLAMIDILSPIRLWIILVAIIVSLTVWKMFFSKKVNENVSVV